MECIKPYVTAPWSERIRTYMEPDKEKASETATATEGIIIATYASAREGTVGMGGVIWDTAVGRQREMVSSFAVTLGRRTEISPYHAELEAVATALHNVPQETRRRRITVFGRNRATLAAVRLPKQQSGQASVSKILAAAQKLQRKGNTVVMRWLPAGDKYPPAVQARSEARKATRNGAAPNGAGYQACTTTKNWILAKNKGDEQLPSGIGNHIKKIDTALPGKHTRALYDNCSSEEARILAQLRTGMARLNGHLHQIQAAESDICACGQAKETVKHFLFCCTLWQTQRQILLEQSSTKIGNLSYFLGGKEPSDDENWKPNMRAVRATIRFAQATKRLDRVESD